jgi:hypothetical protein
MPFSKPKTDIRVKVYPGLDEQLTFVRKLINKKLDKSEGDEKIKAQVKFKEKLQTLLDTLAGIESTTEKYTLFEDTIGSMIHPKTKNFSQLLANAKQTGKLKSKYHNFTTVPYLNINPCPRDCLNIFPGFSLQRFRNTDVDVRKTTIWEWLFVVWSNRDNKKLNWLINYFATKIQQPARKVCKYLVGYGRATGSGKTSMNKYLKALVDEDKVLFCKNLDDFLGEQNSEHLNKLFVLIDEIDRASRSQSDKLKSTITSDSFRYKKLYENPIQMPCYMDLIATSNERSPVFVSSQNRRVELITINPEKKGDEAFWDLFYKELEDSRVMGAWFHFFATFPIDLNVRSENNRFDAEVLCSEKVKSMKSTHQFVVQFFSDPRCFEDACLRKCDEAHWFKDLTFRVTDGQMEAIIRKARAYDYYKFWAKRNGHKNIVKNSTFIEDLREIDIIPRRREMCGKTPRAFVFSKGRVKKTLCCFYQIESRLLALNWLFTDDDEFGALQKCVKEGTFRFRDNYQFMK